jgi:hypothetical protein
LSIDSTLTAQAAQVISNTGKVRCVMPLLIVFNLLPWYYKERMLFNKSVYIIPERSYTISADGIKGLTQGCIVSGTSLSSEGVRSRNLFKLTGEMSDAAISQLVGNFA